MVSIASYQIIYPLMTGRDGFHYLTRPGPNLAILC